MAEMNILLVEDNPADVYFFREALTASQEKAHLHVVSDGQQAVDYLHRVPPFGAVQRPDVMVLDLNLPVKDGREVLEEVGADPTLRTLPVAILTTSTFEQSVCDVYPGKCLYFTKTDNFNQLQDIIHRISDHAQLGAA
jgi:CheY-like chemotaxis protein